MQSYLTCANSGRGSRTAEKWREAGSAEKCVKGQSNETATVLDRVLAAQEESKGGAAAHKLSRRSLLQQLTVRNGYNAEGTCLAPARDSLEHLL